VDKLKFTDFGECEKCRTEKYLCRTGVCKDCLTQIKELKGDEEKIKRGLKELNTAENTIVRSLRGTIQLETFQRTPEIKSRFERLRKERDQRKQKEAASLTRSYYPSLNVRDGCVRRVTNV
jgi:hypothetical protein